MERIEMEHVKLHHKRRNDDRDKNDEMKYSKWVILPNESYKWDFIL